MEKISFDNRKFMFWLYNVSDNEAFLRSPKDNNYDKNVDIHFADIKYIEISVDSLSDFRLGSAGEEDIIYLSKKMGEDVLADHVTVLISDKRRFYIVASFIDVKENTLERVELPLYTYTFMRNAERPFECKEKRKTAYMKKISFDNREFDFWFYQISHSEALLRSPKDNNYNKNIDIHFGDIKYIEISMAPLSDLRLESAREEDIIYLSKKMGKDVLPDHVTVLISDEQRFYIVASIVDIRENTLEGVELPFYTYYKNVDRSEES